MSSRSPRASFSGASSLEVAADFEDSLKDLQNNNRYEISNLTIIAKENTEHAQAISRALENHIKTTSPSRKLPALYVLDSIVKNVGTPYTTYLGLNLFSTFMDAYTLVDTNTRRAMDGMLKTWKEPVPGSIDSHPVFALEVVRPIENALIKAKTAAIQGHRQQQPQGLRGTSTPPQANGRFGTPPVGSHHSTPQPTSAQYGLPHSQSGPPELDTLRRDIAGLIARDQSAFAVNMHDVALRTRLSALVDLQKVLNTRAFSGAELQAIRAQVAQLSAMQSHSPLSIQQQQQPTPQPPLPPQWTPPPQAYHLPVPPTPQNFATAPPPVPSPHPTFTPEALNGLQALLAGTQKSNTPQTVNHLLPNATPNTVGAGIGAGHNDLLASLAKAGLLKPTQSAASTPIPPPVAGLPPANDATASLLRSLQGVLPPLGVPNATPTPHMPLPATRSTFNTAPPKNTRSELITALYDARPNQCSTCGRRFLATEEGRQQKSRHLDWHFRMNQRIADPNTNRGHHRNWYVDEMEWITHVEFDPSTTTADEANAAAAAATGGATSANGGRSRVQESYVRAPPGMNKTTCSICFEDLNSRYSEEQHDWVFGNATMYNGKIVHASCLAEMTQGGASGAVGGAAATGSLAAALSALGNGSARRDRSATPDSTLGKRKAEAALGGSGQRVRLE